MKVEKEDREYKFGSHCVIGCGRELAIYARSPICPTCRGTLYRCKSWTPEHVREYKQSLELRQKRMSLVNEDKPKATDTLNPHLIANVTPLRPKRKTSAVKKTIRTRASNAAVH